MEAAGAIVVATIHMLPVNLITKVGAAETELAT